MPDWTIRHFKDISSVVLPFNEGDANTPNYYCKKVLEYSNSHVMGCGWGGSLPLYSNYY